MKSQHLVATIALALLLVLQASAGRAQALDKPDPSVRSWLPGCRVFLEHPESVGSEAAGQCAGAVDALLYIGEVLEPDYRFCVPLRVPRQEIISTIVANIEAMQPEANRQDFKGMVLGILRFNWPCRE
ncbi:hypothetical protein [Reyranella soli]|jgi:hypothetical protein|uniref:Rap1a immunity protein domain-containing protein n=1 Tax=Reyranella soli TaxID=1230389 RepID=A0A512N9Q5_9HYPH|nr:hypothetical protein [Reyranella soli]GEP55714.1 hypothetical protein RSO01_28800 [Reyranella soli]